ncbi:MAG: hydroxymethylglutaryl-CoA lyase [Phycisphaerales bacterium]|nr:hydroxymethylglutaryl-CoA lyase [Phycisphaerales bacterium]
MTERVRITDVSPRDGLQNEPGVIPTAEKVRLVELLCATGVDEVEVTSFVSPKWVPQLGDAAEVCAGLRGRKPGGVRFSALVPNERGFEEFSRVNSAGPLLDRVCLFTAASETFNRRNTNVSIAESLERFKPVLGSAYRDGLAVKMYISCAFGCPFEGEITPKQVADVTASCLNLLSHSDVWAGRQGPGFGPIEISFGDTIGQATPGKVALVMMAAGPSADRMAGYWAEQRDTSINLHLHDTFGRAAECVKAALEIGVRSFDGSVAGLGGCPYASTPGRRAPGNISTELLVRTVEAAGFKTGVDLGKLEEAARFAREIVAKARAGV